MVQLHAEGHLQDLQRRGGRGEVRREGQDPKPLGRRRQQEAQARAGAGEVLFMQSMKYSSIDNDSKNSLNQEH